ncbi:hypothetical protein [Deinococcus alpinitundrae]|uniref:hypothetical protein n=1 Tax=Deinococcus alpinitundrae TaxID=468913 RepID=UPI001379B0FE|nr:hypothetical protein [Deinococcus alpinitundrae]
MNSTSRELPFMPDQRLAIMASIRAKGNVKLGSTDAESDPAGGEDRAVQWPAATGLGS